MSVDAVELAKLSYFSGLSSIELDSVRESFFEKRIPRGEMIFLEAEPAESLYFLTEGTVKLFKTSTQGKEQIISLARPYDVLNDISIFDNGPNAVSAQAMSPIAIFGIKKDRLDIMLSRYPKVSSRIVQALAARTRQLIALVEDLSFKHVPGRVAKILLENAADGQGEKRRLTQQEMAAMAGTAREVVARSLKALEERGLIRIERHRIIIADRKGLQNIAEELA